jgi:hypothetical protein
MYNPWIAGPRVCPGKKFGQVESVAIIARLFKKGRTRTKFEAGEGEEDAFRRVKEVIEDSVFDITLHMRHPERISLVWEE